MLYSWGYSVACGSCHIPSTGGTDLRQVMIPGPDGMFSTDDDVTGWPGSPQTPASV